MGSRIIFDLETDNLLNKVTKIHCCVTYDLDTQQVTRYDDAGLGDGTLADGLIALSNASLLVGHNVVKYDIPVLQKLHPSWSTQAVVRDTLIISRLIWTNLKDLDFKKLKRKTCTFPKHLVGRHSLEAWGHRMDNHKGEYKGGWDTYSQEMLDYCVQDIHVTASLWNKILDKNYSEDAIVLEHKFQDVILLQENFGFKFDVEGAKKLYLTHMGMKEELRIKLQELFPPWEVRTPFTPKVNSKKYGYKKGVPTEKVKVITFNPGSRDHIASRLKAKYEWQPLEHTKEGKPKMDEAILEKLDYPEADLLIKYLTLEKRLGQIGDGKQAWLKVEKNGRVHGTVNTNGAVTGRCTHSNPNISQVAKPDKLYGEGCRDLFTVDGGYVLVGCDASGIELRCLGHYMAKYDGGAYIKEILEGDVHTANQKATGLPTRDNAKTFIYAFLYGAGDEKIGSIIKKGPGVGRKLKKTFLNRTPALKRVREKVLQTVKEKGYLRGIDGRLLHIRSQHSALNTLLQSAGGLLVKTATVILHELLDEKYSYGKDWAMVAHVHDEMQLQVRKGLEEDVGKLAVESIKLAGQKYSFRCPLDGEYKIGRNWAETH